MVQNKIQEKFNFLSTGNQFREVKNSTTSGVQVKFNLKGSIYTPERSVSPDRENNYSDESEVEVKDVKGDMVKLLKNYNLPDFFEDDTDDSKLLATISNEYSKFNSSIFSTSPRNDDRWYSVSKMVLSKLKYRTMLVKYRYLVED